MRLAPSQAAGRLLSGMLLRGGGVASPSLEATGVPSSLIVGPIRPAVIVPQFEGGLPGRGVIVQQVTMLRTKTKPPIARTATTAQKIICLTEGLPSLMFLSEFILFIEV